MRIAMLAAIVAFVVPLAPAVASAEDRFDTTGYLRLEFGAAVDPGDRLCYGLRVLPAALHRDAPATAAMEVELDGAGLRSAHLGGVDLGRTMHILNQGETAGSSGIGSVLKGIGLGVGALIVGGVVIAVVAIESLDDEDFDPFGSDSRGNGAQQEPDYCVGRIPPPIGSGCVLSGNAGYAASAGETVDRRIGRIYGLEDGYGGMDDPLLR